MYIQINPKYGENYRAGQIYCCYEIAHPISMGISWFSYKSGGTPEFEKVSHVGVCVGPGLGVSAQPHGVDWEDLFAIFDDPRRRIFFIEPKKLVELGHIPLTNSMIARVGQKYDFKLILGFGIVNSWLGRKLPERVRKEILRFFDCKDTTVCSQIIAEELYNHKYCDDPNTRKMPREIVECSCIKPWKIDIR